MNEERILDIVSHVQSASVKLKQIHDGSLRVESGIAAVQTELKRAYALTEKLKQPRDYHARALEEGDKVWMVERTIGPKGSY